MKDRKIKMKEEGREGRRRKEEGKMKDWKIKMKERRREKSKRKE